MPSVVSELCSGCLDRHCIQKKEGVISVNSIDIFREYFDFFGGRIPTDKDVTSVVDECEEMAIKASEAKYGRAPTGDSLKNCRGRWFELVFSSALTVLQDELWGRHRVVFPLPVARLGITEWWRLLNRKERRLVAELRVFSSNPDMICVEVPNKLLEQLGKTADPVELLSGKTWNQLKGKLSIHNIRSFASLKTSMRPDRRYLSLFEAISVKAVASFFDEELKYYVICPRFTGADRAVFQGKTLHDRFSSMAVDRLFTFERMADLYLIAREISV